MKEWKGRSTLGYRDLMDHEISQIVHARGPDSGPSGKSENVCQREDVCLKEANDYSYTGLIFSDHYIE